MLFTGPAGKSDCCTFPKITISRYITHSPSVHPRCLSPTPPLNPPVVQLVVRMHHNPCVPGSKPSEDPSLLLHLTRYRTYGRFAVFPMHIRCNTRRRVREAQHTKRTKNTSSYDSGAIELAILRREFISPISPLRKKHVVQERHREFNTTVGVRNRS